MIKYLCKRGNIIMDKYSVLMSVYYKENPEFLKYSIESMLNQTIKPSDFVIVKDGPLTKELNAVINEYKKKYPNLFNIVTLKENKGLGIALSKGLKKCKNEFVARMDSDDYSCSNRIEKEFEIFKKYPNLALVGSNVIEFEDEISNDVSKAILPEKKDEIYKFSKKRCPFRHPTIMFKKSIVLSVGGYRNYEFFEDYDLFVRLLKSGAKGHNIQEFLVYARINKNFYKRRGGIKYLKHVLKFKNEQYKNKYFSLEDYLKSTIPHIIICLVPNFIREIFYKKFLRSR